MSVKKLPWKPEYGVQFEKTESDTGGNFELFYPILKSEQLLTPKMTFLSIGGGYGAMEVHIAKELGAKLGFIDPSPNLIKSFDRRVETGGIRSQIVERIEASFQDAKPTGRYDLILSIHSWYYIGCDEKQLRKALSLLRQGGTLYIALSCARCPIVRAVAKVAPAKEPNFHLEDLQTFARSIGVDFRTKEYESKVPVGRYLTQGEFNDYGRSWLSYFARKEWNQIAEITREEARDCLVSGSVDGVIRDKFGALIFRA